MTLTAFGAAFFAWWRCRTADRNLWRERYQSGAELLDWKKNVYTARVAGVAALAELMVKHPKDYDEQVMAVFEALLSDPPRYCDGKGKTNFTSQDTVVVMTAINNRKTKQRKKRSLTLPERAPFTVTSDGGICPDMGYPVSSTK